MVAVCGAESVGRNVQPAMAAPERAFFLAPHTAALFA
jgi:hypothetical protein